MHLFLMKSADIDSAIYLIINKRKKETKSLLRWVLIHNNSMEALHEHPLSYLMAMGYRGKTLKYHLRNCIDNEETTIEKVQLNFFNASLQKSTLYY